MYIYGINCYELPDEKTYTLELQTDLMFVHKCLMAEHMDNECHCAASHANGHWDLGWKEKELK